MAVRPKRLSRRLASTSDGDAVDGARWRARPGGAGAFVEQPRDLGHVQADEIRVKKQGGIGVDGAGHHGQDAFVVGRRGQGAARHDVDPGG